MANGDNYRRIALSDQLVFNSAGALVGIRSGQSSAAELRNDLTVAQQAATQALVSGAGAFVTGLNTTNSAAAATANAAAIQAALTAGGLVPVLTPGVYFINKTLLQSSNSMLRLAQGVTLKLFAAANCNILRNKHAGVTITAASFVRASNIATVTEPGHPRAVGDPVLVRNLAMDTSFNGLVTVTAVTSAAWTYASAGSNGSPTGFGYLTPADVQVAAASFVRATNVVTVAEAGHTRQPGDSVYVANLATDTSFNGVYQVATSTIGSSWTYASTGSNGSPTGTGVVAGDNNLAIDGGVFDGSLSTQAVAGSYNSVSACFGIIYGNVGRLTVQNYSGIFQTKYCLWIYNATDVNITNTYFSTLSDCIHFEGPGDRLNVSQVFGNSADDVVAFTNVNGASAGSYLGFASPSGLGNFGVCVVDGIYPSNSSAPALVKVTGDVSTSFRYLGISNLNGSLSDSGGYAISVVDDTASLVGMSINELVIRNISITGGTTSSRLLFVNTTGIIGKIRIENPLWTVGLAAVYAVQITAGTNVRRLEVVGWKNDFNLSATKIGILVQGAVPDVLLDQFEFNSNTVAPLIYVDTAGSITDLMVSNGVFIGAAGAGYGVYQLGTITRARFANVVCRNNDSLLRQNGGSTAMTDLFIDNVSVVGSNLGVTTNTSCSIWATNFKATGLGNNLFHVGGGTVRIVAKNISAPSGQVVLFNAGGSVISYSCPDPSGGIDLGNPAASLTGQTPLAGDQIWNTNANAAATGMAVRTAAGAWTRLF